MPRSRWPTGRDLPAGRRLESCGKLRGQGIATFIEWTGADVFAEVVDVAVSGDGQIEIFCAAQPMGQSLATTFTQLAVDVFGVAAERIKVLFGDTDRGTGFGSAGSRSLFVVGSAVRVASERTIAKAHDLAAVALEAAAGDIEYREGVSFASPERIDKSGCSISRESRRISGSRSTRRAR
jgi:carbon-monoxide dehydrogenase large subunit